MTLIRELKPAAVVPNSGKFLARALLGAAKPLKSLDGVTTDLTLMAFVHLKCQKANITDIAIQT
eukprot:5172544-Amphidinium_carterae.1